MKKIILIIITIFYFTSSSFSENSIEKKLLIQFDGLCVQNINRINIIADYAKTNNWKQIPPAQDLLLAPQNKGPSYQSYYFIDNKDVFMIAINDADKTNTCAIASKYESILNLKNILNKFYKLKLIENYTQGMQTFEIYSANLMQSPKIIISLTYGTEPELNFATISVIKM
jgi:hypothetical protein